LKLILVLISEIKLNHLIQINVPQIYDILVIKNVEVKIFIAEWLFSLFSSAIPLELQISFYEGFFMEGWNFFYKVAIKILSYLENDISKLDDCGDIYIAIKLGKNDENFNEKDYLKKWECIISSAFNYENMKKEI